MLGHATEMQVRLEVEGVMFRKILMLIDWSAAAYNCDVSTPAFRRNT